MKSQGEIKVSDPLVFRRAGHCRTIRSGTRTGAAVGAGASILTQGQSINIPAGTLLEFRLGQPFSA